MFQNSQKARFILEAGCAHKIREMTLKITVNVTGGACRLAPIPLWFDRIEWRTSGGSDLVDTTYGDVMLSKFLVIEKTKLPEVLKGINVSTNWKPLPEYASGTTVTFYMPLVASWIDIANIHWQHIRGDMHIEFHTTPARISGAGNITLQNMDIILSSQIPTTLDMKTNARFATDGTIRSHKCLSGEIQTFPSVSLTAGNKTKIKLDSFTGEAAYLLIGIRPPGASNTNNGLQNCKSLNNGTLDLLTPSSSSILGNGTPIDIDFLRRVVYPSLIPNDWARRNNWYILPFTDSILTSIAGSQGHGYYTFDPQLAAPYLEIGVLPAAVSAVDTITLSADAAGSYRLTYKGFSTTPLNHDATVVTIQSALELLPSLRDADGNPITVTVTGTFAAQGQSGVTIAFTSDNALDPDSHVTFTNLAGNAVHQATSICTVQGTEGWISGGLSSFEVTIYAMMYKKVRSKHGHILITDMYNK